jgi:predicted RNase H-like nuclease (RuvC/YqgF family)
MGLLTPNKNTEEIDSLKTKIAELESKLDNKEKKEESLSMEILQVENGSFLEQN